MDQRFDHLGQLLETSSDEDPSIVERRLRTLLDEEPNTAAAARAQLRSIYMGRKDEAAIADLFERDAARAATPEAAADLYFDLGQSLREMGHPTRAIAMWQRSLRLLPDHRPSLRAMRETHVESGRLDAARAIADREVAVDPQGADPTLFVELGQLALEQPFRYELASSCAEEALRLDPQAPGARAILQTLDSLKDGWKDEARKLRSRAADERDRQVAARVYLKVAGLHAAFDPGADRETKIADALRRTFLLRPALPEGLEFLERRHGDAEDFDGLTRAYEALLDMATEIDPRVDIHLRLANLFEIRFDDRARAIESLARAAALNPGRSDAVLPLVERLEDEGRLQEAADHLERHLSVSPTAGAQRSTRLHLAELHVKLHRPDRARVHFEALAKLDPENERAQAFLAPLLAKEEAVRPQVERLAKSPGDEEALAAVEELLTDPATAPFAAAALEKSYELARDWPSLRHVIELRIEASADPAFRLRQLRRLSLLAGRELRDPNLAFTSLLRAFQEVPGDALLRSELRVAAGQASLVPVLAESMGEVAASLASTGSHTVALTIERELADLYEKRLGNLAEAASCFRRIRLLDPRNVEALRGLHRLDRELGAWEELWEISLALSALVFDAKERQKLWREAAEIALEELVDRELAVEPLRHLAEVEPDALARLERILASLERYEEQANALEGLLKLRPDPDAFRTLALLRKDRLGDPAGALSILETQLRSDPQSREILEQWAAARGPGANEAAVRLDALLAEEGRHEERLSLWETRLAHTDGDDRLPLHRRILAITETDLGRIDRAFLEACRAYVPFPSLAPELERLAAASGSWAELVGVYEDAAAAGAFELRRRIAEIAEKELQDLPAAIAAWGGVLLREPEDLAALDTLARLLGEAGRHDERIEILQRRAQAAQEPADERRAWMSAGDAAAGHDAQQAAGFYRKALAVDPEHLPAVEALSEVLRAEGDREELLLVLQKLLEVAERGAGGSTAAQGTAADRTGADGTAGDLTAASGRTASLRCRLASLELDRGDTAAALALFHLNLQAEPGHPGTLQALEAWALGDRSDRSLAVEILLPLHEADGDLARQVQLLEILASTGSGPQRAQRFLQIAALYEGPLDSIELAFLAAGRALEADPDSPEALDVACRTAKAGDLEEELVGILGIVSDAASEGLPSLLRVRARLLDELGETAASRQVWERIRILAPDDGEALHRLAASYEAEGDAQGQLEVLRTLLAKEEDPRGQRQWLLAIARVQEEQLRDGSGVIHSLRQVLELFPDDAAALEGLDRFCELQERWVEWAEILEVRARLAEAAGDSDAWLGFLLRLAEVRESRLLDRDGAVELYGRILAERPDTVTAREKLQAQIDANPGDFTVLAILEKALAATGDHASLAEVLDARVSATADPEARKAILLELAALRGQQIGRPDLAFLTLSRAFREDPADPSLWTQLVEAAKAAEALEEWLGLWEDTFERGVADRAAALHVAPFCERELGDEEAALQWYERARADDDREVLTSLERLYRHTSRWAELADVLGALAALQEDPAERINLLFRLGGLSEEKLDDSAGAIAAWEQILSVDPAFLPALRALEPLYEKASAHTKLADNLDAQRSIAEGAAWLRLSLRLAEVAAEGVGDRDRAIACYREILAKNPAHEQALQSLEALFEQDNRVGDLVELWRSRLKFTRDSRELLSLHQRIGESLAADLDDPKGAVQSFEAILEREPRHRRSLEALCGLHRKMGAGEALAGALRRLVPLQDDAKGVKAIRLELAETQAALGKAAEAMEDGRRVLDLEPHDLIQLQRVEMLFRELSGWKEVVRTMEIQAGLVEADDPALALELWNGIASLWTEELQQPDRASAALEKILSHRNDPDAFERLRSIYRKAEDWRRYAAIIERYTAAAEGSERAGLLQELATVLEERLGQKEIAFVRLGTAFELRPGDEALRQQLWRLASETGMQEELALIVESVADAEEPGPVAIELFLALGDLHDKVLDDADEAEAALRRALEIDPVEPRCLEALADLFSRRGKGRSLALVLERKLEATAELEEKRSLLHRIGAVYEEDLSDIAEAAAALERAFELDPGDGETIEALAGLYERAGRLLDLASLLNRARDLQQDPLARRDLQLRLAQVFEVGLEDDEKAIAALALALEYDGASLQALDSLERLYGRHDRWAELLRVYDRKLEVIEDPTERSRLLVKAAGIWEENFDNEGHAVACLEGALSYEPTGIPILKELGRLLRSTASWQRLVQILEHHETLVDDPAEKVELHIRLGDVLYRELGQTDAAEAAYRRALALDPAAIGALSALGRLYERSGNWPIALEMLAAEAALLGTTREAVELHHRIGNIHQEMLLDAASAEAAFRQALAIAPAHLPTLRAMQLLQQNRGDTAGYQEALQQEAEHTQAPAEKVRLYDQLGQFILESGGDPDAAIKAFEEARRHGPEDLVATRALAELYVAKQAWEQAEKALDVVCAVLGRGGAEALGELSQRVYRLGIVAEKLGREQKALQSFGRAWELDPSFLSAGEGLARLLVRAGEDGRALRTYQALLIHHRDRLSDPEVVEIHWTIGDLRHRLGDIDAALKSFANGLELDPWHVETHRSTIALAEDAGRLDLALAHRNRLLEILEGEERFELLLDTAKMAAERLQDPWQAIDCYANARKMRPDDSQVLERLVELYRQTRQPSRAVELLQVLLGLPDVQADGDRCIRFHLLLGEIFGEEAGRDPSALAAAAEHFNAVLDRDWRRTEAFVSLERALASRADWRGLESNYLRMLQRMPREEGSKQARVLLYRSLGDLYLNALQDSAAAAEAFKAVTVLAPDDGPALLALARHQSGSTGMEAEAIATWRKALPHVDDLVEAGKQLEKLHVKQRDFDGAWVAASVITEWLGQGGSDEAGIIEKLSRFARTSASGSLSDDLFREALCHEGVRGNVAMILGLVRTHAGEVFASGFDDLVIDGRSIRIDRRRQRVDLAEGLFFVHAYQLIAGALACTPPELYRVPGVSGVHVVNTWPLAVVVGEEMFTGAKSKKELYFAIARQLVYARSRLTMALMDKEALLPIFEAAISLGEPRFKTTVDPEVLAKTRRRLEKALPAEVMPVVQRIAHGYARDRRRQSLATYLEAARLSSARAGLLFSGDFKVSRAAIGAGEVDLVRFALSDSFTELRAALGLAVVVPG